MYSFPLKSPCCSLNTYKTWHCSANVASGTNQVITVPARQTPTPAFPALLTLPGQRLSAVSSLGSQDLQGMTKRRQCRFLSVPGDHLHITRLLSKTPPFLHIQAYSLNRKATQLCKTPGPRHAAHFSEASELSSICFPSRLK